MKYGITGNILKTDVWDAAVRAINWFADHNLEYCVDADLGNGLSQRQLLPHDRLHDFVVSDVSDGIDIVLSLGGDGTLLRLANNIQKREVAVLGINIGRLGFLADVEVSNIEDMLQSLENGSYSIEQRTVLCGLIEDDERFALNEFVISRSGTANLISIETHVDGRLLNTYWADGLIVSTSTGSTAYSLSVGGPIILPGSGVLVLSPIAPHTLTVRPVIIPDNVSLSLKVTSVEANFTVSGDGHAIDYDISAGPLIIKKATHKFRLVKLDGHEYFETLRKKLGWGR